MSDVEKANIEVAKRLYDVQWLRAAIPPNREDEL